MTNLNNIEILSLYNAHSNPKIVVDVRQDLAATELKSASWMTRSVVSLREPTSKFALVNKIRIAVATALSCLLFKSSTQFIARRNEILGFDFTAIANTTRCIETMFGPLGFGSIPAKMDETTPFFTGKNEKDLRFVTLRVENKDKTIENQAIKQEEDGSWSAKGSLFGKPAVSMIDKDGKLVADPKNGELYYDRFMKLVKEYRGE